MATVVSLLPRLKRRSSPAHAPREDVQAMTPGQALSVTGEVCSLYRAATDVFALARDRSATFHGVRRLTSGQRGKRISIFPSAINDGNIPCEGFPEKAHCLVLERLDTIAKYRSQPLSMRLPGGQLYTPDKATLGHDGAIHLYEVKSRAILASPSVRAKLTAAKDLANLHGMGFHEVAHDELPDELEAVRLARYYHSKFFPWDRHALIQALDRVLAVGQTARFEELCTSLRHRAAPVRDIRHAIFLGHLLWDMTRELRPHSELLRVR